VEVGQPNDERVCDVLKGGYENRICYRYLRICYADRGGDVRGQDNASDCQEEYPLEVTGQLARTMLSDSLETDPSSVTILLIAHAHQRSWTKRVRITGSTQLKHMKTVSALAAIANRSHPQNTHTHKQPCALRPRIPPSATSRISRSRHIKEGRPLPGISSGQAQTQIDKQSRMV
jgi:hypothetical protein